MHSSWCIIPLTDCTDVNIQPGTIYSQRVRATSSSRPALSCRVTAPPRSQLFIRLHIHRLSITAQPPGPVTSLYVYCSVPPSRAGWLTCSQRTEVGLARSFFSNRGSRGGGFSLRAPVVSQSGRHERNNNTWWPLCVPEPFERRLERSSASTTRRRRTRRGEGGGGGGGGGATRSTFNPIRSLF